MIPSIYLSGRAYVPKLDMTYTSVGGSGVGCVELCGISTMAATNFGSLDIVRSTSSQDRHLVLVFKYANIGPVRDYLRSELPQRNYQRSWELIIDMLSSVANGIYTLHRHGVIHRSV